ncbi:riboflavin kinase [Frondihabitans sp. PhB188]|uniref:riboflavin kinase n=1 Tax=Frondihabitans sp. PhB188 TaxID=2485200 RepID=UPI000F469A4C|nr:riboflavin kinase [Frondihabitans sp. PhB188]
MGALPANTATAFLGEPLVDSPEAARLALYPTVTGRVVHGEMRGRELGFPTANLDPKAEGVTPADGVYAAWVVIDGRVFGGAVSVGNNPTFEGVPERQIEAHILDASLDLYDREISVHFVRRVRGNVRFEGLDALVAQIAADVANIRGILAERHLQAL